MDKITQAGAAAPLTGGGCNQRWRINLVSVTPHPSGPGASGPGAS